MPDLAIIVTKLADAKAAEERAKAARLRIEEELAAAIGVPDSWTGSTTSDICGYKVTCARRDNVKIDIDELNAIAARDIEKTNGHSAIADALHVVFRWKPEIDKKGWDAAPDEVVKAFSAAITRTPGKISFTLKLKDKK